MPEEYLQTAFEIKTACDEISRRLLRWHWEQKSGAHSLEALMQHLKQRQQESPEYYDRLPELTAKSSWQQLDTTLCMRVLLDPEKDTARPLDLLGNTAHPAAARRACNAVRTARNEAAHAADRADAAHAALLFNDAIECLEEGYANSAFREAELSQYYRQAEEYLSRFGKREEKPTQPERAAPAEEPPRPVPRRKSAGTAARSPRPEGGARSGGRSTAKRGRAQKKNGQGVNKAMLLLMLVVAAIGLLLRGLSMRQ